MEDRQTFITRHVAQDTTNAGLHAKRVAAERAYRAMLLEGIKEKLGEDHAIVALLEDLSNV